MTASESSFNAKTKILTDLYSALNRNDIPTILKMFSPQIVRTEFEDSPAGGTYRGIDEVEAHFIKGRETWADGGCHPERFVDAGDKVVVLVFVKVKLKRNQEWVEGRCADVFTFRDGKIIHMHTFADQQKALESVT